MNVPEFQAKWRGSTLKERSAAQEFFLDLCDLLGMPKPAAADKTGAFYTFEKGAAKTGGGEGFADVWWQNHFAWEFKGHRANLAAAYAQLLQYREDLGNPPLLVVCDLDHFQIHTNFTGTAKQVYAFTVEALDQPANLKILRAVFADPEALKPKQTVQAVTEEAAAHFGALAAALDRRGLAPHRVAHFLVQMLFGLFAEDVGLLPKRLFTDLLTFGSRRPDLFPTQAAALFQAMRDGGVVNYQDIARFNGGLFAEIDPLPLTAAELDGLARAAVLDWGSVEPAIFGTLFERSLDPAKRSQLGAHYTGRRDIERVVEPVVLVPLRRRWETVRAEADDLKAAWDAAPNASERTKRRTTFAAKLFGFQEELAAIQVLDPACGSGNFLYVALAGLKNLEKEVVAYGTAHGLPAMLPRVGPSQLHGLEVNEYARELAQTVIWIGYLQWMTANGFQVTRDPVLESLETIRLQDALLDRSDPTHPQEACWPHADFIIGNPPFLGGKRMRAELGDDYVETLHRVFADRLPPFSDLCCYFFEKAREAIANGRAQRAGLLATNSIRGGANRRALERIKETGDIFMAWSDEPWVLDGAAVRISIVGFDGGCEKSRNLDGKPAIEITSALTGGVDLSNAARLPENSGMSFIGDQPTGPFDVPESQAEVWLALPLNPNGRPNSDVLRPYFSGSDITGRWAKRWVVDFGVDLPEAEAALYEAPFEYIRSTVKPARERSRERLLKERWWLHWRPRPEMRQAIAKSCPDRFLCTPHVSKYRLFVWLEASVLPNNLLIVFARQDDYFFGVLHSRAHEVWSLRMGTSLEDRPRYTPTTCFETFPLPWPPGQEPWRDPRLHAIAEAARELDARRQAWLNPPGASETDLKKRTLTNLYNQRPTWLAQAHAALDRAVWAAYGWDDPDPAALPEDELLARLLALNQARAAADHSDGQANVRAV